MNCHSQVQNQSCKSRELQLRFIGFVANGRNSFFQIIGDESAQQGIAQNSTGHNMHMSICNKKKEEYQNIHTDGNTFLQFLLRSHIEIPKAPNHLLERLCSYADRTQHRIEPGQSDESGDVIGVRWNNICFHKFCSALTLQKVAETQKPKPVSCISK